MNYAPIRPKNPSITVAQLVAIVKRHGEAVLLSQVLLAVAGIVGVSLWPNVYRATTTILVDPQKIPEKYVSSTVTTDPNARMNTLTQQVLSASRLEEIIGRNDLYPELRKRRSREEMLDFMREKTKIEIKQSPEPEQGLSSFSISYEDRDRALVAPIANQLAAGFIDWNLKTRQQQALGTSHFLSRELEQAKLSLEEQETSLEDFKLKHVGATPDELSGNLQAMSRMQSEVQANEDAISRLDQERILLARIRPADSTAAPLSERDRVLQERRRLESERWTLKRQFTDSYPDVIAVDEQLRILNTRLAGLPEPPPGSAGAHDPDTQVRLTLIDKEIQRHEQELLTLQGQIRTDQSKVDSVPVLETQLADLTRNYDISKQNYQSLLEKTFSAGMSEELERTQQGERFTVLDMAKTPEKPVRPKRLPLMAGILFLAMLLPVAAVFGVDRLGGAVHSEAEVRSLLLSVAPVFVTIPPITSKASLARQRVVRVQTIAAVFAACVLLAIFLLRVRPIV